MMTTILYRINVWMGDGMAQHAQGRAVMFILAALLCGGSLVMSHYLISKLTSQFLASLRKTLLDKLLATRVERLEQLGSSQLYSRLTLDINALADSLAVIPGTLYNIIIVSFLMFFMWMTAEVLFYTFVGFLVAVFLLVQLSTILMGTQFYQHLRDAEEDMYDCYRGVIYGAKELATSKVRRNFFRENVISPVLGRIQKLEFKAQYLWSINTVASQTATFMIIGIMALITDAGYAEPHHLLLFVLIILYLMGPLLSVFSSFPLVSRAVVSYQRVRQVTEHELEFHRPSPVHSLISPDWQVLRLQDVSYQYQSDDYQFTLGPVSLEFNRGDIHFVVGGNGSGKSTLFRLIAGLYKAQSGDILLDNQKVTDCENDDYRNLFGCIFTDFYLFKNVVSKRGGAAEQKTIDDLLQEMRLDNKVQYTDGKLSQLDLSTGQKKRLAYVQCTALDKQIYLFDEWAADQDPVFKHYFYTELLPQMKAQNKTLIVISHDDRYTHVADKLITLQEGKVLSIEHQKESQRAAV